MNRSMILRMREVTGLVCLAEVRRLLRDALSSRCRIFGKSLETSRRAVGS